MQKGQRTRRVRRSGRNRIENGGFEKELVGWQAEGVSVISAEAGGLVHSGTRAAKVAGTNAFLAQTVSAGKGARLQFIAHMRGAVAFENGPVLIRLRWVTASGSFLGMALEAFIAPRQLPSDAWNVLWDVTGLAPGSTAGLHLRIDAPQSENDGGIIIDDVVLS